MSIPVTVTPENGAFTASVLGRSELKAAGATRDAAVAALQAALQRQVLSGDLTFIDLEPRDLASLGEKYRDDPNWKAYWDDIATEIYRQRIEEKAREFPE